MNPTTINKNASSARIDLCSRIFAGLDQEVDDVEDVEGSPREEEYNAHTDQDPEKTIEFTEVKLFRNLWPIS